MSISAARVTRFGIGGQIWRPAGDFSGKEDGVVVVVEEAVRPTGGWWGQYEQRRYLQEEERKKRLRNKQKAKEIHDKLHKALALAERKIEEDESREEELRSLTLLVKEHEKEIRHSTNERIAFIAKEAYNRATFSKMEQLERELKMFYEEEEFILMAARLLLNEQ